MCVQAPQTSHRTLCRPILVHIRLSVLARMKRIAPPSQWHKSSFIPKTSSVDILVEFKNDPANL